MSKDGRGALIDLTGQRFGLLVVEKKYPVVCDNNGAIWLCKCDCGVEVAVPSNRLRYGKTKSCGCFRAMTHEERMATGLWPKGKGAAAKCES